MTVNIETIIVSALVAAIVGALVNYFFTPRLSARNERILAAHRDRQRFHNRLMAIGTAAARLKRDRLPNDISIKLRQALLGEDQRALDIIDEQTRELLDDLGHAAGTYAWRIKDVVMEYAFLVRGWSLSERTVAEKGHLIVEITVPIGGYLAGSPWRPFRRARYLRETCTLIEQHTGTNPVFRLRKAASNAEAVIATD